MLCTVQHLLMILVAWRCGSLFLLDNVFVGFGVCFVFWSMIINALGSLPIFYMIPERLLFTFLSGAQVNFHLRRANLGITADELDVGWRGIRIFVRNIKR